jgi:hypothetical protein
MQVGPKHCFGGWGGEGVKTTENKIHLSRWCRVSGGSGRKTVDWGAVTGPGHFSWIFIIPFRKELFDIWEPGFTSSFLDI